MLKFKKGDIVVRKSYNQDIKFYISQIREENFQKIAILKGITIRIEATATLDDLEKIDKRVAAKEIENAKKIINSRVNEIKNENLNKIYTGRILHLDGDRKYTDKSYKYYRRMGLDAVVKYIPENKQPIFINRLLDKYKPDILIITRP